MARVVAMALALPVLVLAGAYKFHTYYGVPIGNLMRDPNAIADVPYYVGAVSNFGVLLWCAAAGVSRFGFAAARRCGADARFMLASAALRLLLMFDDLLMLHEAALPQIFGWPEKAILAAYGGAMLAYLAVYRRRILAYDWPILGLAFALFAGSLALDRLGIHSLTTVGELAEDGCKFLGAAMWLTFQARTAWQITCSIAIKDSSPACEAA